MGSGALVLVWSHPIGNARKIHLMGSCLAPRLGHQVPQKVPESGKKEETTPVRWPKRWNFAGNRVRSSRSNESCSQARFRSENCALLPRSDTAHRTAQPAHQHMASGVGPRGGPRGPVQKRIGKTDDARRKEKKKTEGIIYHLSKPLKY